jgi:hypothetical protein
MSFRDHPAFRGYDLENLRLHGQTPEGRAFLEGHRALIRGQRARSKAMADDLNRSVELADELLLRFALVLDEGGSA